MIQLVLVLLAICLTGCAVPRGVDRAFNPRTDGFTFANELRWQYEFPESGEVITRKTEPPPQYSLRCFPMVRAAREFFYHARFRPGLPKLSRAEYRQRIQAVIRRNSRSPSDEAERIEIPGFDSLHTFSAEFGDLLQEQCGGAARSFLQRGNWRMVFPVSESGQRKTAENFLNKLRAGQVPIAHIYQFPNTTLNHAVLVYAGREEQASVVFSAYDPNSPDRPTQLIFDRERNTFTFERNRYFGGGPVRVYEVYRGLLY